MSEIPRGAIRFNTDSNKPELWDGSQWAEFQLSTPNLGRGSDTQPGARGLTAGGNTPGSTDAIDYINISSTGNAIDFGNLITSIYQMSSLGSNTRSIFAGGSSPGSSANNQIQFVTISSTGNGVDFGNLPTARRNPGSVSNSTRGVVGGGANGPETTVYNVLEYITISSTGDAVDFGDLTRSGLTITGGISNSIRGVFSGGVGTAPTYATQNTIDFITIPTLGDAQDFGDLSQNSAAVTGCSNSTRGILAGGGTSFIPSVLTSRIDYITISTKGNVTSFGNLTTATNFGAGGSMSSPIRGVFSSGHIAPGSAAVVNTIEYVNIATQGNSVDFGDSVVAARYRSSISNAHGGL